MKRYLSGIFAIVLAVVFSSFTSTTNTKTLQTFGFWYHANGTLVGTAIYENAGSPVDKQSSTVQGAISCPDVSGDVCAMGYPTQLTPGDPIPSDLVRDGEVLKN